MKTVWSWVREGYPVFLACVFAVAIAHLNLVYLDESLDYVARTQPAYNILCTPRGLEAFDAVRTKGGDAILYRRNFGYVMRMENRDYYVCLGFLPWQR